MSGSTSNFLFQGTPTPSQPTGSDTANSMPAWLSQYVYNLSNAATNLASQPYTTAPMNQVAQPSADTQNAWNLTNQNLGGYQPALAQAGALTAQGGAPLTAPNPITASPLQAPNQITAAPVTASALNSDDINQYLNPFQDQVIGALRRESNENLFSDVLPNVQDRFVSAGQSRSPQEMQATNNAVYKSNMALDDAIAKSLSSGYNSAVNTAAQQKGFLTGLGTQQQGFQTQLAADQQAKNTAFQQQQQGFLTNLATQQQGVGLDTATKNRTAAQTAGAQFGQLGALGQQLRAADVGQLAASGQQQDTINQSNVNAALNNFYAQQQWPYQNLGFASNIIRGLPVNTNQQTVGQTYNATYSPSPISQFIGTTLGASALGLKDGGHVKRPPVNGALSVWRKAA